MLALSFSLEEQRKIEALRDAVSCEWCDGSGLAYFLRGDREVLDRCSCGAQPQGFDEPDYNAEDYL